MEQEKLKSCSTCKNSIIRHEFGFGFFITNAGCDNCNSYNRWKFDNLSIKERWSNETGQSQFRTNKWGEK